MLSSTPGVDDYVDLETLRRVVSHPAFSRPDLEAPLANPADIPLPEEPPLRLPDEPTGVFAFLRKGNHDEAVAAAKSAHEEDLKAWRPEARTAVMKRKRAEAEWSEREAGRGAKLQRAREQYDQECRVRADESANANLWRCLCIGGTHCSP